MTRFLVLGEINADLVLSGEDLPEPGREVVFESAHLVLGSASAICAAGLAKLGNDVAFAGLVGDDLFGRFCLDEMRRVGIDVSAVTLSSEERTGVTVSLSTKGDRALATYPGATERFSLERLPESFDRDHLHVSSFFLQCALRPRLRQLFEAARAAGASTSLDPGHDPSDAWDEELVELLDLVDLFLPNEEELRAMGGEAIAERTRVIVKLGRAGAEYRYRGEHIRVEAPEVSAVDTTGAGDSFNAGFLHAFTRRLPIETCLRYGVAAGSLSTRALGGTGAQPSLEELEAALRA